MIIVFSVPVLATTLQEKLDAIPSGSAKSAVVSLYCLILY